MLNKATDAVSKMTIKMNEQDVVSGRTWRSYMKIEALRDSSPKNLNYVINYTIKVQKRSKDIVKIIHMTSGVQP